MTDIGATLSVLHVCSDYAKQSLYPQLLRAIAAPGIKQFMYVPVRTAAEVEAGRIYDDPSIGFRFKHLLRPHHKLFFRTKVRRVLADIIEATPVATSNLIHAHFLYSDGAVALGLHREFGLPYVVAVRNGDVNVFMRYRRDLIGIRNAVLQHASRVIFLSPAYAESLGRLLPTALRVSVAEKTMIVPNGLSSEWLEDSTNELGARDALGSPLRLLYVGDFTPNKNISGIVAALRLLQAQRPTTLSVVGGGGDEFGRVQRLLDRHGESGVTYLGRITDRALLRALYSEHDILVMPSFRETFGLTYIEALSQGVPIVHSRGQGVDGYFNKSTVSAAVDPFDPRSIAHGVMLLANCLPDSRELCRHESKRFDWKHIGETYRASYHSIVGNGS